MLLPGIFTPNNLQPLRSPPTLKPFFDQTFVEKVHKENAAQAELKMLAFRDYETRTANVLMPPPPVPTAKEQRVKQLQRLQRERLQEWAQDDKKKQRKEQRAKTKAWIQQRDRWIKPIPEPTEEDKENMKRKIEEWKARGCPRSNRNTWQKEMN